MRLREVRKARGLTQVQLAQRTGLDQATISRIERGRGGIDYDVLDRLRGALECEPGDLLVRESRGRRTKKRSR